MARDYPPWVPGPAAGGTQAVAPSGDATGMVDSAALAGLFAAGGTVWLRDGTYTLQPLALANLTGLSIKGSRSAIIKLAAGTTGDLLTFTNCDGVTLDGITVDGNKANQTVGGNGIVLVTCTHTAIRRVNVQNMAGRGISATGGSDLDINQCTILANGLSNTIDGSRSGIVAITVARARVTANTITGCSDSAIVASACTDSKIADNIIATSNFAGIGLGAGAGNNIAITGNVVRSCVGNGIDTGTAIDVAVTGNTISDCFDGIDSDTSSLAALTIANLTIAGNKISRSGRYGIAVFGAPAGGLGTQNVSVTGNTIDTTDLHGIAFAAISNATISGNVIRNPGRHAGGGFSGIEIGTAPAGAKDLTITGNRIYETVAQSFAIDRGPGVALNNFNIYTSNSTRTCAVQFGGTAGTNDLAANNT